MTGVSRRLGPYPLQLDLTDVKGQKGPPFPSLRVQTVIKSVLKGDSQAVSAPMAGGEACLPCSIVQPTFHAACGAQPFLATFPCMYTAMPTMPEAAKDPMHSATEYRRSYLKRQDA